MTAKKIISIINSATSLDEITEFENDKRVTVLKAFSKKSAELTTPNIDFSIVIPYVSEPAQGNELQMALRSIDKHMKDKNYNIIIIGDVPDYINRDEVICIEQERDGVASTDGYSKWETLLKHEEVADRILMTYDDIYLINPVSFHDFIEPLAIGPLKPYPNDRQRWQHNKNSTRLALEKINKARWNYSSHSPKIYVKEKVAELHDSVPQEEMFIFEDYYFNFYADDDYTPVITKGRDIKIGVYRSNPDWNLFNKLLKTAKFINNSPKGWTPKLSDFLQKTFPNKSRFEI